MAASTSQVAAVVPGPGRLDQAGHHPGGHDRAIGDHRAEMLAEGGAVEVAGSRQAEQRVDSGHPGGRPAGAEGVGQQQGHRGPGRAGTCCPAGAPAGSSVEPSARSAIRRASAVKRS
jgi:hypothetical protein